MPLSRDDNEQPGRICARSNLLTGAAHNATLPKKNAGPKTGVFEGRFSDQAFCLS